MSTRKQAARLAMQHLPALSVGAVSASLAAVVTCSQEASPVHPAYIFRCFWLQHLRHAPPFNLKPLPEGGVKKRGPLLQLPPFST